MAQESRSAKSHLEVQYMATGANSLARIRHTKHPARYPWSRCECLVQTLVSGQTGRGRLAVVVRETISRVGRFI